MTVAAWLVIWVICAVICGFIASAKGLNVLVHTALGATLGVLGVIITLLAKGNEQ